MFEHVITHCCDIHQYYLTLIPSENVTTYIVQNDSIAHLGTARGSKQFLQFLMYIKDNPSNLHRKMYIFTTQNASKECALNPSTARDTQI